MFSGVEAKLGAAIEWELCKSWQARCPRNAKRANRAPNLMTARTASPPTPPLNATQDQIGAENLGLKSQWAKNYTEK